MDFLIVLGSQSGEYKLEWKREGLCKAANVPTWSQRLHLTGGTEQYSPSLIIKSGPCKKAGVGGIKSNNEYGTAPAGAALVLFAA